HDKSVVQWPDLHPQTSLFDIDMFMDFFADPVGSGFVCGKSEITICTDFSVSRDVLKKFFSPSPGPPSLGDRLDLNRND
ncbi:MAG TPA: hypothetical protein PLH66_06695, partial [Syntrophales bacterium]|nr:hypothetical protein [Syntrophales bacterium]